MRVNSPLAPQYNYKTKPTAEKSQQFASLLNEQTAGKTGKGTVAPEYIIRDEIPVLMNPSKYEPVRVTGKLTEEEKSFLREKYDFDTMEHNSGEYHSLMRDLHEMGVISHPPMALPLGIQSYTTDSEGNITFMMVKVDKAEENLDVESWFSKVLSKYARRYQEALLQPNPSNVDRLFMKQYDSNVAIKSIQKDLF